MQRSPPQVNVKTNQNLKVEHLLVAGNRIFEFDLNRPLKAIIFKGNQ